MIAAEAGKWLTQCEPSGNEVLPSNNRGGDDQS